MSLKFTPDEIEQWISRGIKKTLHPDPVGASPTEQPTDEHFMNPQDFPDENSYEEALREFNEEFQNTNNKHSDLMSSKYDFAALAEKFHSDEETIKTTIEKMEAEFRADIPGESDEMYKQFVMHDLGKTMSAGSAKDKADEFNGVIVAVSRAKDLNDYPKRLCWKEYANDPKAAVKSGYIKEEFDDKGNVVKKIPLETKETLPNGEPNPNFGKPIEYKRAREMIMVLLGSQKIDGVEVSGNGEIVLVRANLDNVKVGQKSTVYGKKSAAQNKPYTSVVRGWADFYEESGPYSNAWSVAEKVYDNFYFEGRSKDELGNVTVNKIKKIALSQIADLPSFGYFVTKGYVQSIKKNDDGTKVYLAINDDDGNSVRASTNYEPLVDAVDDLCDGDEVIFVGERSSFKNDEGVWTNYNILMGVVKNPKESDLSAGLKRLAEARAKKNKQ